MNYGENLLKKFGWKEGDGLGKQNDGIAKPIKVKLKNDQMGLGYNKFDYLSSDGGNWWENMYDKASQSLQITNNDKGDLIVTKQKNIPATGSKKPKKTIADMTSDELLKLCNGRTAHKGARFGLKLAGKLKRVADQDQALLLSNDDSIDLSNHLIKNQSKIKLVNDNADIKENTKVNIKNKRKKNKKSIETDDNKTIANDDDDDDNNIDEVPRKKLKKNKIIVYATDPTEANNESDQEDCDTTNTTLESSVLEINSPSLLNLKKKPKTKRKL